MALPDSTYAAIAQSLQSKRDLLVAGLRDVGLPIAVPAGTYFVVADVGVLGVTDALQFCRDLPRRVGVVGIPVSVFHDDVDAGATLVRFAFCKRDEVLLEAVRRLAGLRREVY